MNITDTVVQPVAVPFGTLTIGDVFFDGGVAHGLKLSATTCLNLETTNIGTIPADYPVFPRTATLTLSA